MEQVLEASQSLVVLRCQMVLLAKWELEQNAVVDAVMLVEVLIAVLLAVLL